MPWSSTIQRYLVSSGLLTFLFSAGGKGEANYKIPERWEYFMTWGISWCCYNMLKPKILGFFGQSKRRKAELLDFKKKLTKGHQGFR